MKSTPAPICIIRHAQSMFNLWDLCNRGIIKKESLTLREQEFLSKIKHGHDPGLMDPPLTDKGISQAVAAQTTLNARKIKYVFISPLHRTLETARIMFETHPNKSSIHFQILPIIHEVIQDPDDIPIWNLKTYKNMYPNFDFSLLEEELHPNTFFLDSINSDVGNMIKEQITLHGESNYPEMVLTEMHRRSLLPDRRQNKFETFWSGKLRGIKFSKFIAEFLNANKVLPEEIAVVTHSVFMRCLMAKSFNEFLEPETMEIPNAVPMDFDISPLVEEDDETMGDTKEETKREEQVI